MEVSVRYVHYSLCELCAAMVSGPLFEIMKFLKCQLLGIGMVNF